MKYDKRMLKITSIYKKDYILEKLKNLEEWTYTEENMMGTHQRILKHKIKNIEIYLRYGIEKDAWTTSNIFPQDNYGVPERFEEDDLYLLFESIRSINVDNYLKIEVL